MEAHLTGKQRGGRKRKFGMGWWDPREVMWLKVVCLPHLPRPAHPPAPRLLTVCKTNQMVSLMDVRRERAPRKEWSQERGEEEMKGVRSRLGDN